MASEIYAGIIGMRNWSQLVLVLVVTPLLGVWGWLGKYGSKFEDQSACAGWVNAGPTITGVRKEFRTRSKTVDFPSQWAPPLPREWSVWMVEDSAVYVPRETPSFQVALQTI